MVIGAAWWKRPAARAAPTPKSEAAVPMPNRIGPESTSASVAAVSAGVFAETGEPAALDPVVGVVSKVPVLCGPRGELAREAE
jgi:hypothetical protein